MMGKLVMIVDDSPTVCTVISVWLRRADYESVSFSDGLMAYNWLNSSGIIPDLFLIDLCLPKLDGYDVIRLFRSQPVLSKVPFVIISRRVGLIDMLKGKLAGASDHLAKPLETDSFLSIVNRYLNVPLPLCDVHLGRSVLRE